LLIPFDTVAQKYLLHMPGPDNQRRPSEPGKPKMWFAAGRDINDLARGSGHRLMPLTTEQTTMLPEALIQTVKGVPYTYASIVRQLDGDTHGQSSKGLNTDTNNEGEPMSGAIPTDFLDAYKRILIMKKHKAPYAQFLGSRLQAIASQVRRRDKNPSDRNEMLNETDLLILNTPRLEEIRRDNASGTVSLKSEPILRHTTTALKDPVGYILWTIRNLAETNGVSLVIDTGITKRLKHFHRRHTAEEISIRRPLAEPGETQK
jgi:hypothetical protein